MILNHAGFGFLEVISRKRLIAVGAIVLAMVASLASQTVPQTRQHADRITQQPSGGPKVAIAGTVHPLTRRATDLGAVDSNLQMESLTLNIGPSAAQQSELNGLIEAQQDPKSPLYHQWLTQEDFGARFGLTDADLSKVTGWLAGEGFTVKSVAPSRNLILFSGTVSQVAMAFRTQIHRYRLADGTTHSSNATEVTIPRALVGVVTNVRGLNSFRPKPRASIKRTSPQFTSGISGSHFLTPSDWAIIYNVGPIYNGGQTGTGMHVGIVGQTYFPQNDIDNFRKAAGLDAKNLNMVCITKAVCTDLADESVADVAEADLDVEWAGGIARDATVDYIYTSPADQNQNVVDALFYGITFFKVGGSVVPVLSMSYGNCESDVGSANINSLEHYFEQAASQGQTILNSSGDAGAAGCDQGSTISAQGLAADWPASSPLVTGVGGTKFSGDGMGAGGAPYWSSTNTPDGSSALQYIPETSWNDTAAEQAIDPTLTLSSSGGGVSIVYPLPSWQWVPSNYAGPIMRFVPDVSFAASADHDGYLICTQDFTSTTDPSKTNGSTCVPGTFRYPDGKSLTVVGGTSAGSPSFAGMLTLLVQKYGTKYGTLAKGLGPINSKLYSLASDQTTYAAVFHDITTGDDKQPCSQGTGCSGGIVGYLATTGYDLVTGLGSINGGELYLALGSTKGLAPTTTTITAAPNPPPIGGTTTLTVAVTSSTPGTINGPVTIKVGDTLLSSPISPTQVTAGTATLNVPVSAASGFSYSSEPITAAYGGDATFAPSSGSTALAGFPTTTSVTASPSSLITGGTVTLSALVGSMTPGTPAGTVMFEAGSKILGVATVSGGTATLSNVPVSAASGLSVGVDSITASYGGDINFAASGGSTALTVMAVPSYTLTGAAPATIVAGSSTAVTLNLTSTNYAGTVSFTTSVTINGASSNAITASATPVTLTNGGSGTSTLTITSSASAANHDPAFPGPTGPWKSGGAVVFCAVLLGAPYTLRRKRALAVLLIAATMAAAGFLMSCGGGAAKVKVPRTYTVTVAATGAPTVANPAAVSVAVTVP